MKRLLSFWILCGTLLLFGLPLANSQASIPEPTDFLVNDYAQLLTRDQTVQLGQKLRNYVGETSTQIVVVTIESLEGADPFQYSVELAQKWGIGGNANDNGVLLFVSEQDRAVRIQTGYGAEGFLPDALAKRIIDTDILPAFRQGNYYQGIDRATNSIMQLGKGEYEGTGLPSGRSKGARIQSLLLVIGFVVFLVIIISLSNRGGDNDGDGGYWGGGRYDMGKGRGMRRRRGGGWVILPGPGWGWGGGGSSGWGGGGSSGSDGWGGFGGGGFGGFGGGDFGGGGAGGSW